MNHESFISQNIASMGKEKAGKRSGSARRFLTSRVHTCLKSICTEKISWRNIAEIYRWLQVGNLSFPQYFRRNNT